MRLLGVGAARSLLLLALLGSGLLCDQNLTWQLTMALTPLGQMKLAQKASTHLLNNASGSERVKLLLCCLHAAFQVEFVFDVIHPP